MTIKVGDKVTTWFSERPDGKSTVTAVRPYTGRYKEFFTHFITLSAPRTDKGTIEMAFNDYKGRPDE